MKPAVQRTDHDTLLCFTVPQAKALARIITKGLYSDSLATRLETENYYLRHAIEEMDHTITAIEMNVAVLERMSDNQQTAIYLLEKDILEKEKTLKHERKQKRLLGIALTIVTVLAIL